MTRSNAVSLALVVVTCAALSAPRAGFAQAAHSGGAASGDEATLVYPRISDYGGIFPITGSTKIAAGVTRQIVLDVTAANEKSTPHSGLEHAARALNLYAHAGVPVEQVAVAVVVHGEATSLALSDAAYRRDHGSANPNTALLRRLRNEGVDVKLCAQALKHHGFAVDDVSPHVTLELSAMTALEELQRSGYALIP